MSTSRHIDRICVIVTVLTLIVTLLFMNGRALGIEVIGDGDGGDGQFTENDLNGDWDASGATYITLTGDGAGIDGNGAYFAGGELHLAYAGRYVLSGELADGSVVIDTDSGGKVWLLLDGVDIHNEDGAALLVEQAEKVFVTLAEGAENSLSSGASYRQEDVDAGIDGAVYSRDDLTINGSGSLTVTAEYRHGIVCNDDFVITGGAVTIDAVQDGIHANDSARLCGMELTITAGDDGVTVSNDAGTGYFYMESGALSVPACYEGVEAANITVAGGTLDIVPTDDGLNANSSSASAILVTGGEIRVVNETGRDADGLDSNGSIFISGGSILISVNGTGGNCALDAGTESGGVCQITGGTVIAAGGSTMAEGFDSTSTQGFLMQTVSGQAGAAVELKDDAGATLLEGEIPCAFTSLILSAPELEVGDTCTLSVDGVDTEVVIDNSAVSAFGPGGMGGQFGGGMFGGRGGRFGDGQSSEDYTEAGMGRPLNDGITAGGFTPPDADGAAPEGDMTPPEGAQSMPSGGSALPNSDGSTPSDNRTAPNGNDGLPAFGDGQFFGRGQRPNGMSGGQNDPFGQQTAGGTGVSSSISPETLILVGVSVLLLAVGIVVALRFRH